MLEAEPFAKPGDTVIQIASRLEFRVGYRKDVNLGQSMAQYRPEIGREIFECILSALEA